VEKREFWLVYVYGKGGNEREMKGKLSDPSPFNNIFNNIQFLLALVGIKHSYL
jgi:hypothetical protein